MKNPTGAAAYRVATRGAVVLGLALGGAGAFAQSAGRAVVGRPLETRESLLAQVRAADSLRQEDRARLLRDRLENGDFREGDRVVLMLSNVGPNVAPVETLAVVAGQILDLPPTLEDLPLRGVLRSELRPLVAQHLTRWYREPEVRVVPLIRIAVLGAVARQDFLYVPPEMVLTDVITLIGGLASNADPGNTEIKRGTQTIWKKADVRAAMLEGYTVDRMHLRAGDQIVVGTKPERNIMGWVQLALATTAVVLSLMRDW